MGRGVVGVRQEIVFIVAAAIAGVACADHTGHVFGGEFERGVARALADALRGDLINRDAGTYVFAFGAPGMNAAEEGGARAGRDRRLRRRGIGLG